MGRNVPTINQVIDTVNELFDKNGTTTTLEIKQALREKGFHAVQWNVANTMYQVNAAQGWSWAFNGTYRHYYPTLAEGQRVWQDEDACLAGGIVQTSWYGWLDQNAHFLNLVSGTIPPAAPPQQYNAPTQTIAPVFISGVPQKGDWAVFDYTGTLPSVFVGGDLPDDYEKARTAVRTFYSQEYQIKRESVGATIVAS